MVTPDLNKETFKLVMVATNLFNEIISLPPSIRKDEKERTGIQVFIREPGTRNLVFFSVESPSAAAMTFSVEKAIRSYLHGDSSSENSADPDRMEFQGSVTVDIDGVKLQASVSGLFGEEDTLVAVKVLAYIFDVTSLEICKNIMEHDGKLPIRFFTEGDYLCKFINS